MRAIDSSKNQPNRLRLDRDGEFCGDPPNQWLISTQAIDAVEVQQSLSAFLKTVDDDAGFVAQLSFHNCHIPFVGAAATVSACRDGDGCLPENRQGQPKSNYSAAQLDFYACLLELDAAVGAVLRDLRDFKRYDDTLVYFTTDNGPEGDRPRGTHIFNPTSTVSTRAFCCAPRARREPSIRPKIGRIDF